MEKEKEQTPHIVVVPSPGMGHLIPLVEFSKLLVSRFNFTITLLLPTTSDPTKAQISFLNSLPKPISHSFLPPVDPAHLPPGGAAHEVTISAALRHSIPAVRAALAPLAHRVAAFVTDLFGTEFFDVARGLGIPPYMYFTSNGMCALSLLYLPKLDETVSCEYRDMPDPVLLPGCVPLHGRDFVEPAQDRKDEAYTVVLNHVKRYNLADGIFINTFVDLEPGAIHALQTEDTTNRPPAYPVGPIIQSGSDADSDGSSECLKWLDQQPPGSVLFVSFGSGGTLSYEQLIELALGLERSGHRFLWVVRSPSKSSFGSFFTAQSQDDPLGFLPNGFVDRVKDRGLLVPSWAPQIKVLSHGSTGGFVSHCGWNSTLESIVHGVPLIAWPLYAEQRLNAVLLNQGLKVALRPTPNERGVVEADEIARVVKDLMENEEGVRVRLRMKELSDSAKKAIGENGDSTKLLEEIAHKWSRSKIQKE